MLDVTPILGACDGDWETEELWNLRVRLLRDPYSMALLQEALAAPEDVPSPPAEPTSGEEQSEGSASEPDEELVDESFVEAAAHWQESLHEEADRVWDVIGLPAEAFKASTVRLDDTDDGSISSGESLSETDTEVTEQDRESSTSSEETSDEEDSYGDILLAQHETEEDMLTKGQRRRLLAATREIGEVAEGEIRNRKTVQVPRNAVRRRWRILELFTWTCMISQVAYSQGWEFLEPITLPGWDLTRPADVAAAKAYLKQAAPDFLVVAWPCSPWSSLQNLNMKTPTQRRALRHKRAEARRTLLSFTRWAVLWQRRRGGAVIGENPFTSLAWRTPEIADAFHGCAEAIGDQCCFNLRHPETGQLLKKRTRFMGQELVVKPLRRLCPKTHEHGVIEGSYKGADGRWRQVSEWAGGYPPALCRAMLKGGRSVPPRARPGRRLL